MRCPKAVVSFIQRVLFGSFEMRLWFFVRTNWRRGQGGFVCLGGGEGGLTVAFVVWTSWIGCVLWCTEDAWE